MLHPMGKGKKPARKVVVGRVGVNVSMSDADKRRYETAATKAPGRPTLSQFLRMAADEKIARDKLD